MSRINHSKSNESTNPTTKYLSWGSNKKKFTYYDGTSDVDVDLPFKFLFLQHYHTIKGWNDESDSRIYSNEVYYIGSEPLSVKSFKGKRIAEGLYSDIKASVISAGGKYHRSVYVMLEDGSIANLSFKGAVVKEWTDFFDKSKHLLDNQWVEIKTFEDKKKGSIKFTTPTFEIGANLTKSETAQADDAAAIFQEYINKYFGVVEEQEEEKKVELDF